MKIVRRRLCMQLGKCVGTRHYPPIMYFREHDERWQRFHRYSNDLIIKYLIDRTRTKKFKRVYRSVNKIQRGKNFASRSYQLKRFDPHSIRRRRTLKD